MYICAARRDEERETNKIKTAEEENNKKKKWAKWTRYDTVYVGLSQKHERVSTVWTVERERERIVH